MKKKILFIENDLWSLYNFRQGVIKRMSDEGHDIYLAAFNNMGKVIKINNEAIFNLDINSKSKNIFKDLKLIYQLINLYKRIRPDYVCLYSIKPNIYGNMAGFLFNLKTISNINGLGNVFMKESFFRRGVECLYKIALKKTTKTFFQNSDDFELFTLEREIVNKKKCDILPGSGVNLKKFKFITKNKSKKLRFLLVSRMLKSKGVLEFIEAAKILKSKNLEFCLLGPLDVENNNFILKSIEQVKDVVTYLGVSDDVRKEISESDCIVLPSYYREGVPKVLIEAAAIGRPIITTKNVGCKEIVEDKITGFLCNIRDVEDLVNKMKKYINLSEAEKEKMGYLARKKVEKEYDENIIIEKYISEIK